MFISIVTPTFNRCSKIIDSIESSCNIFQNESYEIIVVDDASTDNTLEILKRLNIKIKCNLIIKKLPKNIGVTGAKNIGIQLASGKWIAFMDSDDYFLPNCGEDLIKELKINSEYDICFFRCQTKNGKLIGVKRKKGEIKLYELLNYGTPGECLPVIKKSSISQIPYRTELRGGESITYLEMLRKGMKAYVSDIIVRVYDDSGNDRLSKKDEIKKRSKEMLEFNLLKLQHIKHAKPLVILSIFIRILYYKYFSIINNMKK